MLSESSPILGNGGEVCSGSSVAKSNGGSEDKYEIVNLKQFVRGGKCK